MKCLRDVRSYVLGYTLLDLLNSVISMIAPFIQGYIIDKVIQMKIDSIKEDFFILFACLVFLIMITFIKKILLLSVCNKLKKNLRCQIVNTALNSRDKGNRGVYISKMEDVDVIADYITDVACPFLVNCITFILLLGLLINISIKLTIMGMMLVPINVYFAYLYSNKVKKWEKEIVRNRDNLFSFVYEILDGICVIKELGISDSVINKYMFHNEKCLNYEKEVAIRTNIWAQFLSFIMGIAQITLMFFSCLLIVRLQITVGEYYTFNSYYSTLNNIAITFISWYIQYASFVVAEEHTGLDLCESVQQKTIHNNVIKRISGYDIGYSYDGKSVFKNITFTFCEGNIVYIEGRNGVGKTTFMKIVANIITPEYGYIKVNGDLMDNNCQYRILYFNSIQFLFNISIFDNMRLAVPRCEKQVIYEVLELLGMKEFVNSLPEGLDTVIGERSDKISKGQMQGLALVRAFLLNADVYLFDEPNIYLDKNVEENFYNILLKMKKEGKIVILSSHNDYIKKIADVVINMNEI